MHAGQAQIPVEFAADERPHGVPQHRALHHLRAGELQFYGPARGDGSDGSQGFEDHLLLAAK